MTRKLTLRKEALTQISTDELTQVVGGQVSLVPTCRCTGYYPSLNAPCPTTNIIAGTLVNC